MRIGVYGGTFDPPHSGHLILAAEAQYQLKLDRVLFVLTPDPPHKQNRNISPVQDRLAMLHAALEEVNSFQVSKVEIDRPGPHYSVDTVRILKEKYPEDVLVYLMGGDSLKELPINWYQPAKFVGICDQLGVMRRPYDQVDIESLEKDFPEIRKKVVFVEAPLLEIASRQIRSRVAEGRPYRYYLPKAVFQVIQERGLYQNK